MYNDACHCNIQIYNKTNACVCTFSFNTGVLLKPLCFVLEWAPGGSLHSVLQKYRKADARISPMVLQETARQVCTYTCAYIIYHIR